MGWVCVGAGVLLCVPVFVSVSHIYTVYWHKLPKAAINNSGGPIMFWPPTTHMQTNTHTHTHTHTHPPLMRSYLFKKLTGICLFICSLFLLLLYYYCCFAQLIPKGYKHFRVKEFIYFYQKKSNYFKPQSIHVHNSWEDISGEKCNFPCLLT